jgi:hypothetical protein
MKSKTQKRNMLGGTNIFKRFFGNKKTQMLSREETIAQGLEARKNNIEAIKDPNNPNDPTEKKEKYREALRKMFGNQYNRNVNSTKKKSKKPEISPKSQNTVYATLNKRAFLPSKRTEKTRTKSPYADIAGVLNPKGQLKLFSPQNSSPNKSPPPRPNIPPNPTPNKSLPPTPEQRQILFEQASKELLPILHPSPNKLQTSTMYLPNTASSPKRPTEEDKLKLLVRAHKELRQPHPNTNKNPFHQLENEGQLGEPQLYLLPLVGQKEKENSTI